MGKDMSMRGLTVFISDIRACKSTEAEEKRINKELANIRQRFGEKKPLDGYDKKKYICKLLFIFLLGHDVEFGHVEAVNLMTSLKYSEKQMGYLFVSVLLTDGHDLAKLVLQNMKEDLASSNELHVCLALHLIATMAGKDMSGSVMTPIVRLLVQDTTPAMVKKKASLALLHTFRKSPETFNHGEYASRIAQLLSSPDYGVLTAVLSLLTALAQSSMNDYAAVVPLAINRVHRLWMSHEENDYTFYAVPAPWISVKLFRLLQVFPRPSDSSSSSRLSEVIARIFTTVQDPPSAIMIMGMKAKPKSNYHNAMNGVFFEALNLIVHYDSDPDMQIKACKQLGSFLISKEPNMRYLALEGLLALSQTEMSRDAVKKHQPTILNLLKLDSSAGVQTEREKDPTIQRRAVDVLYSICDPSSVRVIVTDLLSFLPRADYSIREELVLKIAILAEKHVTEYSWYVDVILRLIRIAGDFVSEEVWHRVIQIIVNRQDVQDYAAKTCFEALLEPSCHEAMVCVGSYVLGEFGHLIANDPASGPQKQLDVLQGYYGVVSPSARCLILSTYVKFANLFPEIKPSIQQVLRQANLVRSSNAEIQQRALEYLQLTLVGNTNVLPTVLEEMPPFPEKESSILAKLEQRHTVTDATGIEATKKENRKKPAAMLEAVTASRITSAPPQEPSTTSPLGITNEAFIPLFIGSNSGVLYENPVLQVGVQSEFHTGVGRVTLFYGNRGQAPFTNVSTRVYTVDNPHLIKLQAKPIETSIAPGVQVQQVIQVECVGVFTSPPLLDLSLTLQGRAVTVTLKLPIFLNKFLEPLASTLTSEQFFAKWNQLGGPPREVRNITKSKEPINRPKTAKLLNSMGMMILDGIDPNLENLVCAAILHTSSGQIGCLLRVEPNRDAQMYRFTLRASNEAVAQYLCNFVASQF